MKAAADLTKAVTVAGTAKTSGYAEAAQQLTQLVSLADAMQTPPRTRRFTVTSLP